MASLKLTLHKLAHWEYWPMQALYYPIFPIWLFYAIRARSFFFFNTVNPSIKNGGMAMESKKDIYDLIPSRYIPKTMLVKKGTLLHGIMLRCATEGIGFPMIAKPDVGLKSLGVERIEDETELKTYMDKSSGDFLVQELIPFPKEIGVFYVRLPNQNKGKITGMVSKEFLSVTGDGKSTLLQLIKQNPRSSFQLGSLKRKYENEWHNILPKGEKLILVPYGSHTRGAKFMDISDKISAKLTATIDGIASQIPGFYFGRLDILYHSLEMLEAGKNFSIIEVNGAGSEPTHIYDPKHSIFFAWKEIAKHWNLMYRVSAINFKKGYRYLSFKEGRDMIRANNLLESQLKLI